MYFASWSTFVCSSERNPLIEELPVPDVRVNLPGSGNPTRPDNVMVARSTVDSLLKY